MNTDHFVPFFLFYFDVCLQDCYIQCPEKYPPHISWITQSKFNRFWVIFGKQNLEEISCEHLILSTTSEKCFLCTLWNEVLFIWFKLHCFLQNECLLNSYGSCFATRKVKLQTRNSAEIVRYPFLMLMCTLSFLSPVYCIILHILLEFGPLWICWLSGAVYAEEIIACTSCFLVANK